jgi:hypothetical protein
MRKFNCCLSVLIVTNLEYISFFFILFFFQKHGCKVLSISGSYSLHWVDAGSIQRHWQPPTVHHEGATIHETDDDVSAGGGGGDVKRMQLEGYWHLDTTWANHYDLVWSLVCTISI